MATEFRVLTTDIIPVKYYENVLHIQIVNLCFDFTAVAQTLPVSYQSAFALINP